MTITARAAPRLIEFTVPCVPVAQPRPRAMVINGHVHMHEVTYLGKGETRRTHPVVEFKAAVKMALRSVYAGAPLAGGVRVKLSFVMPRPASMRWKRRPTPRVLRIKGCKGRGDWDNIAKAFCDSLNGIAWQDDSQICSAQVDVYVASGDEQPAVYAEIEEVR